MAIENLQRLADQSNGSIEFHLQLSQVFRLKGDLKNAIAILQRAAVLRPTDPRPPALLRRCSNSTTIARRARPPPGAPWVCGRMTPAL